MTIELNAASSEDLMVMVGKRDEYAFEILLRRHQTSILNLIYRYVGDRTKARDLAQEVFIRVWQAAKSYEPKAKFTTWIYRITANLCLNELKSAGRKKLILFSDVNGEKAGVESFSDGTPSGEDLLLAEERIRQISEALQSLPENQRMALILKRYDHLSYDEISQVWGVRSLRLSRCWSEQKEIFKKNCFPMENERRFFHCFLALFLVCIPCLTTAGQSVKVEVLYMNHGPLQSSLQEIRNVFSQYKGKIAVSWYDFESKEGEDFMAKKRLTQHIPLAIWMDDQVKFKVDDKEVIFAGFPTGAGPISFQGKWKMADLQKVLDQLTGKK